MKIQIVSEYFYPDNFRINDITAELVRQGHTVQVLTGLPDYATGTIPPDYRGFKRRKEQLFGARVRRVAMTARHSGAVCRALNYGTFLLTSSLYALFCKKPDCDVIFVFETSPVFQALPAILFKWRTGKRLVLHCYDLWPECMKAWGVGEQNPVFRLVKQFSGWLYRQCDVVAITSTPFRDYLNRVCGVSDSQMVYLPQYAQDEYAEAPCAYEENGCIDFLFAGNIGAVQNVEVILKAAAAVHATRPFRVHLVGDGSELESCKRLAEELALGQRVVFHGRHPQEEMKRFYQMADCFLLTLRGGDFIGKTLPAKAQGYLCAGKPILAAVDGAASELIAEANCGAAVAAGDAAGLAGLMARVLEDFEHYREKGKNGRRFYEQHYTKDIFMAELLHIFEGNE